MMELGGSLKTRKQLSPMFQPDALVVFSGLTRGEKRVPADFIELVFSFLLTQGADGQDGQGIISAHELKRISLEVSG